MFKTKKKYLYCSSQSDEECRLLSTSPESEIAQCSMLKMAKGPTTSKPLPVTTALFSLMFGNTWNNLYATLDENHKFGQYYELLKNNSVDQYCISVLTNSDAISVGCASGKFFVDDFESLGERFVCNFEIFLEETDSEEIGKICILSKTILCTYKSISIQYKLLLLVVN